MRRRNAMGIIGAAAIVGGIRADEKKEAKPAVWPPKLDTEELAKRVKAKGFVPESVYAHEVEFRGVVLMKRDIPLLQIKGMDGPFSKVHLHGSGGNVDVGKEMIIKALIVDHGYGALMMWKREWKYADDK